MKSYLKRKKKSKIWVLEWKTADFGLEKRRTNCS